MSFDVEVPGNGPWKAFPIHERLTERKRFLDLVDKRRKQERDPFIGREAERRLLDYELADLAEATNRSMKKAARRAAGSQR